MTAFVRGLPKGYLGKLLIDHRTGRECSISPLISQLELAWEEHALEHFWSPFTACARVLLFDRRGGITGSFGDGERLDLAAWTWMSMPVPDA